MFHHHPIETLWLCVLVLCVLPSSSARDAIAHHAIQLHKGKVGAREVQGLGKKAFDFWGPNTCKNLNTLIHTKQRVMQVSAIIPVLSALPGGGGGGGVLRFGLDRGVLFKPQKPYPSLRVILAEKGTQ